MPEVITADKQNIGLPLKLALTSSAIDYFLKNQKRVQKIQLADSRDAYGFIVKNTNENTLKHLLKKQYLKSIETSDNDLLSKKTEIINITSNTVYSLLQTHFDYMVLGVLVSCNFIQKWNRANPKNLITIESNIPETVIKTSLQKESTALWQLKQHLLAPVYSTLAQQTDFGARDKKLFKDNATGFIENMSQKNWYILSLIKDNEKKEFYNTLSKLIDSHVQQTKIADYLGTILIELIMNAENANISNFAKEKKIPGVKIEQICFDPVLRNKVLQLMTREEQKLYISWYLKELESTAGHNYKLQISIYNRDYKYRVIRKKLMGNGDGPSEVSLDSFLSDEAGSFQQLDMSSFYLTSLRQACEEMNMHFDSTVTQFSQSDIAAIGLNLFI